MEIVHSMGKEIETNNKEMRNYELAVQYESKIERLEQRKRDLPF